ncbi:hypothetical protein CSE16_02645 [Solibacillus sp. R5-41]|uniref:hypothetical protein n=1 Tax=Solibacillus sp. R5-41 TaxID=2048654 RepID=UPI000C12827B|nr:hypothetical protein [Solibacillus sp. R5-41]ATP39007.1 hypothetical protein CSE16_02645 [Solibacillus sp. R5-41]
MEEKQKKVPAKRIQLVDVVLATATLTVLTVNTDVSDVTTADEASFNNEVIIVAPVARNTGAALTQETLKFNITSTIVWIFT